MIRAVVVAALLAGCGAGADPNAAALHDLEAALRALDRALGVQTAFVTSGNIDVGATPDTIAGSIEYRLRGEALGCVTVSRSGPALHADFGGGCALATASMRAGGTVDALVEPDPTGGIDVALTLALTVDGQSLGGSFTVATANGNTFGYAGTLTLAGSSVSAPLLHAGIAAGGATLDAGNASVNGAPLTLAAAHQRFAGCYPDDGTAMLRALRVSFASDTPQTGAVTLSTGRSAQLPRRAGCLIWSDPSS